MADRRSSVPLLPLQVRVQHAGATAHVVVAGDLDMLTAPQLQSALDAVIEPSITRLVLDLREVEFLGSTGIASLDRLDRRARTQGFAVIVVRGSPAVQRVLEIAGLPDRMDFVDTPDEITRRTA